MLVAEVRCNKLLLVRQGLWLHALVRLKEACILQSLPVYSRRTRTQVLKYKSLSVPIDL